MTIGEVGYKAHIPNIHALNSDTHTLFLSILILNSQCVGVAIEGNDIWYMGRDGKGFFILHGTIDQVLVSLLLHSPPQMIFSGHMLYRIIRRMKVFKSIRKYHLRSKIGLYTSDESSFLSKYSKYSEIVSICFEIYFEEMMTPSEFQRKFEIFAENFIPFQYFPTLFHHFQPFST